MNRSSPRCQPSTGQTGTYPSDISIVGGLYFLTPLPSNGHAGFVGYAKYIAWYRNKVAGKLWSAFVPVKTCTQLRVKTFKANPTQVFLKRFW